MQLRVAILTTETREHLKDYGNPKPAFGTPLEALFMGFARIPEVEVHVISCTQQPIASPEKLTDNIYLHCLHVPKIGWMRTGYQGCIRAVRKKLREIEPDIVHGQGTERDCAMDAVLSGFPNVLTIHGIMEAMAAFYHSRPGSFHWLAARLESFALRRTAGVFCNSAYTEARIQPRTTRTWRVPNALRMAILEAPRAVAGPAGPVLLNVGVLSPYKRQREILAMAGRLWQRGLRFELLFAGGTENRTDYGRTFLSELVKAEKAGYARHLGFLSAEDLIVAMDSASALVHTPVEESFGLVVAEALARNLKLFASATGGVVDIATGVECAELFPATDWTGMEQSIANWLESGFPRPATSADVMQARYHPRVVAQKHIDIYQEVLAKGRAGS